MAGQVFQRKGRSHLAAVDFGRTIPASLRDSGRYEGPRSDHEWIAYSLERGVTCKSRETNRGFGLAYLKSLIAQNGGSMYLLSGGGIVSVHGSGIPKAEPLGPMYGLFPGTMIILDIRTEFAS